MFTLVIYPKDFHKDWQNPIRAKLPEVIVLDGITNLASAREFAQVYMMERFESPNDFDGCHVVEVSKEGW